MPAGSDGPDGDGGMVGNGDGFPLFAGMTLEWTPGLSDGAGRIRGLRGMAWVGEQPCWWGRVDSRFRGNDGRAGQMGMVDWLGMGMDWNGGLL